MGYLTLGDLGKFKFKIGTKKLTKVIKKIIPYNPFAAICTLPVTISEKRKTKKLVKTRKVQLVDAQKQYDLAMAAVDSELRRHERLVEEAKLIQSTITTSGAVPTVGFIGDYDRCVSNRVRR